MISAQVGTSRRESQRARLSRLTGGAAAKLLLFIAIGPLIAQTPDEAAILAIKAVRSVTNAGVTFRAYSDRVLEARVRADQAANLDPKLKLALEYYETAMNAWSLKTNRGADAYRQSLEIGRKLDSDQYRTCMQIAEMAASLAAYSKKPLPENEHHAMMANLLSQRPNLLWTCAADLIDGK